MSTGKRSLWQKLESDIPSLHYLLHRSLGSSQTGLDGQLSAQVVQSLALSNQHTLHILKCSHLQLHLQHLQLNQLRRQPLNLLLFLLGKSRCLQRSSMEKRLDTDSESTWSAVSRSCACVHLSAFRLFSAFCFWLFSAFCGLNRLSLRLPLLNVLRDGIGHEGERCHDRICMTVVCWIDGDIVRLGVQERFFDGQSNKRGDAVIVRPNQIALVCLCVDILSDFQPLVIVQLDAFQQIENFLVGPFSFLRSDFRLGGENINFQAKATKRCDGSALLCCCGGVEGWRRPAGAVGDQPLWCLGQQLEVRC
eukprot:m.331185 g.331185  ORF g.331185 m.331185 type:complete len:307 (-) comp55619_c0_seq4:101-1021(-)